MLLRAHDIIGRKIDGADAEVGKVKDIFFDETTWDVRYLVVDTGGWLESRELLLAPVSLRGFELPGRHVTTHLTRQQVEDSPPVVSDMPLSRAYEERLHAHYGWSPYWTLPMTGAVPGLYTYPPMGEVGAAPGAPGSDTLPKEVEDALQKRIDDADRQLRSFKDVKGSRIEATDGEIGHVSDALLDPSSWRLTHFIVDTRSWLPGRQVVVDRGVVRAIRWEDSHVVVALTKEQIKGAPEYDERMTLDDTYKTSLSSYYRRSMEDAGLGGGHAF
jgi:uncharacterized protein YrrD